MKQLYERQECLNITKLWLLRVSAPYTTNNSTLTNHSSKTIGISSPVVRDSVFCNHKEYNSPKRDLQ